MFAWELQGAATAAKLNESQPNFAPSLPEAQTETRHRAYLRAAAALTQNVGRG